MERDAILRHIFVLEQSSALLSAQGAVIFLLNHVGKALLDRVWGISGDLFLLTQPCKPVGILMSL